MSERRPPKLSEMSSGSFYYWKFLKNHKLRKIMPRKISKHITVSRQATHRPHVTFCRGSRVFFCQKLRLLIDQVPPKVSLKSYMLKELILLILLCLKWLRKGLVIAKNIWNISGLMTLELWRYKIYLAIEISNNINWPSIIIITFN